jgi:hypothetical protein
MNLSTLPSFQEGGIRLRFGRGVFGAGNTFLKLFSLPEIRTRVIRIKEMLEGEG